MRIHEGEPREFEEATMDFQYKSVRIWARWRFGCPSDLFSPDRTT